MIALEERELERLVRSLEEQGCGGARVAVVLGSGLGELGARLADAKHVPYADLPGMPASGVVGHAGELVRGELAGVPVLLQRGRVHLYEGRSPREVTRAVRAFAALGVRALLLTNAAGGLDAGWPAGTLMRIDDHVNQQRTTSLLPGEGGYGRPYDAALGEALASGAREAGVKLEAGVYLGLPGPTYETPAEIRMLQRIGADAVGMSTVLEASAAWAAGLRVCGISLISNPAAGLHDKPLAHDEVVAAGQAASERFCALVEAALPHIDRSLV